MKVTRKPLGVLLGRIADVTLELASEVFNSLLPSPLVAKCRDALRHDHSELLDLTIDPSSYGDPVSFANDYLAVSLLSKYPDLKVKVDRERVALDKLVASEVACAETNHRLRSSYAGGIYHHPWLSEVLYRAQLNIGDLLPRFSWEDASKFFGFGPGASLSLKRTSGDAYYKFGHLRPTVTLGCAALAWDVIRDTPPWYSSFVESDGVCWLFPKERPGALQLARGNRITTVPKNAKGNRTIAIEPELNMYLQKGIGGLIRRSLRSVGIDLNSQEKNQELAREGSITGDLATLDLASASDSVTTELVRMLLPPDWTDAVFLCRSPEGRLPSGDWFTYQKVSSMGNGFTFELESLIFWALSKAVLQTRGESGQRMAIYGDDIIVPTSSVADLTTVLNFCGFQLNADKSFWEGMFRESCGKHWFKGVDVTPIYFRKKIDNPERIFWYCNSIQEYAARGFSYGKDSVWKRAYDTGVKKLPVSLRVPSVPLFVNKKRFSDTALAGDFDICRPKFNKGLQTYVAEGWCRIFSTDAGQGLAYLARQLSVLEAREESRSLEHHYDVQKASWLTSPFGSVEVEHASGVSGTGISSQRWKYRKVKTCITQWDWIGPWI